MTRDDLGELFEVGCDFLVETDKAILINSGDLEVWIPLSQISEIHGNTGRGSRGSVVMSAWIAKKKGLIL